MTDDEREAALRAWVVKPRPDGLCHPDGSTAFLLARLDAARTALESAEVNLPNRSAAETADRLREIAEQGRASGAFGGSEVEAAAQAILALSTRTAALEAALREVLKGLPDYWPEVATARQLLGEVDK